MRWRLLVLACGACGRIGFTARAGDAGDAGGDAAFAVSDATMLPATAIALDGPAGVAWTALDCGSVDARGVFTAPTVPGDCHVQIAAGAQTATATVHVELPGVAHAIAPVGTLANATGMSSERRMVYVDDEWWVFFASSLTGNGLSSAHSADFVTWAAGAFLATPNGLAGDGRNIDVAARDLGGHHVVHAALSYETGRGRYHVRGEIAGGAIAWGAPQVVNQGGVVSPDGPSVVITAGGQVVDGTGYLMTPQTPPLMPCGDGDNVIYTAAMLDTGTTSFDAIGWNQKVVWCVGVRSNARRLLSDGETLYDLFDDAQMDPQPDNLFFNVRRPDGAWLPDETTYTVPPRVFATDTAFQLEDWDAMIVGRTLHAIRRLPNDAFEHATYDLDAGGPWTMAAAPVNRGITPSSGVVLEPYGVGMLAVIISGGSSLQYAYFDGTAWTPWHDLGGGAAANRFAISGGAAAGVRPAIMWTEQTGTNAFELAGVQLP
ncbi:MAG: hypothetical protein JO257_01760 [Deltaproteobacteria bacterium]|nr:hypothetical protein [Deltaproteobacteria bacterium]